MRKIILITFLLPFLLYGVYSALVRFVPSEKNSAGIDYSVSETTLQIEQGASQNTIVYEPEKTTDSIIVMSDEGLDPVWNTSGISVRIGDRIARYLAGGGHRVFLLNNSGRLSADTGAMEAAAKLARSKGGNVFFFGHGIGCAAALKAGVSGSNGIVLAGCAFPGTLLDHYGEQLIFNMERTTAHAQSISRARAEFHDFSVALRSGGAAKTVAPGTQFSLNRDEIDIQAFREALTTLAGRSEDLKEADGFRMTSLVKQAAAKKIPVLIVLGYFDEEVGGGEIEQTKKILSPASGHLTGYSFIEIPGANHFFQEREGRASGEIEVMLNRRNPFIPVSGAFLKTLEDFLSGGLSRKPGV